VHFDYAVQAGLLTVRGTNEGSVLYTFTHDRILQAASSLLDAGERRRVHLAAGIYLLHAREAGKSGNGDPYEIANHLNEAEERRMIV